MQLFNAVHKQQALVDQKIKDTGTTESRREKVMQSLTKGQFLDMLKTAKVSASKNAEEFCANSDLLCKSSDAFLQAVGGGTRLRSSKSC